MDEQFQIPESIPKINWRNFNRFWDKNRNLNSFTHIFNLIPSVQIIERFFSFTNRNRYLFIHTYGTALLNAKIFPPSSFKQKRQYFPISAGNTDE